MSTPIAAMMQQAMRWHMQGALPEAIREYRAVLALAPRHPDVMNMLGVALIQSGQAAAGERSIRDALAQQPDSPSILSNLGSVLVAQRRFADAADSFRKAVQVKPDYAAGWSNLGNALRELGELGPAEEACRTAVRLDPHRAEAHANLGNVLRLLGRAEDAAACYKIAAPLLPQDAMLHMNYGGALRDLGQMTEAEHHAREALRLAPDHPQVRYALAQICLATGQQEEGWVLFEARRNLPEAVRRSFTVPVWDGARTDLPVLIHAEEGIGDMIQYARFVAEAARRTRVVLEAPRTLQRLFQTLDGPESVMVTGDALPPVAAHLPLMSLPYRLGTIRARLAETVPYLRADPPAQARWVARLAGLPGRRVGLVWGGNPKYLRDSGRSMPFALLQPLLAVPGVSVVSLQKDDARAQIPPGAPIHDWTDELEDFADTAALVAALDLVISVDTAVAHLAGALGRPVWLLNRFDSDWRWELGTTESIWYPTLRQFRQPKPGDWPGTVAEVAAALAAGG